MLTPSCLQKGADPEIDDCWRLFNVYTLAERLRNEQVLRVLRGWKAEKRLTAVLKDDQ